MANWYNQVFEKAPEKGAPPRMYELPHVFDPQNEDEEIEKILDTYDVSDSYVSLVQKKLNSNTIKFQKFLECD